MHQRFGMEIALENLSKKLNPGWMTSCSTKRLEGSELDQAGECSKVRTE